MDKRTNGIAIKRKRRINLGDIKDLTHFRLRKQYNKIRIESLKED
jgi:hypothetical protein